MKRLISSKVLEELDLSNEENLDELEEKESDLDVALGKVRVIAKDITQLYDCYVELFSNLNDLYTHFPKLYDEMKLTVKFPDKRIAKEMTTIKSDISRLIEHYQDDEYLGGIIGVYKDDSSEFKDDAK